MIHDKAIKEEHKVSCVQFELRVECCSIVKTVEDITAGLSRLCLVYFYLERQSL